MKRKPANECRFASRYLLPVEIFSALVLFGWGYSGWVGFGALNGVLYSAGISRAGGVTLCSVSGAQLIAAMIETVCGRRWGDKPLLWSVSARCGLALGTLGAWAYIGYLSIVVTSLTFVTAMVVQAPVGFVFAAIIFVGNLKVRCVLDPSIPTDRLERAMLDARKAAP